MIDSEENYKVTERAPCTGTIKAPLGQRGKDQVCTKQGVAVGSYQVQQPALSIGGLSGDKMVTVTGSLSSREFRFTRDKQIYSQINDK